MSTQNWAKGIDANGRPISAGLIPDEKGVRVCPANGGATNWYSPTYDPDTHVFYFRSFEACATIRQSTAAVDVSRWGLAVKIWIRPGPFSFSLPDEESPSTL